MNFQKVSLNVGFHKEKNQTGISSIIIYGIINGLIRFMGNISEIRIFSSEKEYLC